MSDWKIDPQHPGFEYRDLGRHGREMRPIALIARHALIQEAITAEIRRFSDEWWRYAAWEYNRRAYGVDVPEPSATERTKQTITRAMDKVFTQPAENP